MSFPTSEFDLMKTTFTEKYGAPHSSSTVSVRTRMNVPYRNVSLRWRWNDVDANLERFGESVERGRATITTAEFVRALKSLELRYHRAHFVLGRHVKVPPSTTPCSWALGNGQLPRDSSVHRSRKGIRFNFHGFRNRTPTAAQSFKVSDSASRAARPSILAEELAEVRSTAAELDDGAHSLPRCANLHRVING